MYSSIRFLIFTLLCTLLSVSSQADVLFEQSPYSVALDGIQSDASTPPAYQQVIPTLAGSTLDKIVWWGFHGSNSAGSSADSFEVFLGGNLVTGSLSSAQYSGVPGLTEYVLDITDTSLTATTIDIWNNSDDVEWYWQTVSQSDLTAFRLEGTRASQPIPEPGVLGLFGIAALVLSLARRRQS